MKAISVVFQKDNSYEKNPLNLFSSLKKKKKTLHIASLNPKIMESLLWFACKRPQFGSFSFESCPECLFHVLVFDLAILTLNYF